MQIQTIRTSFKKTNLSYGEREKFINEGIVKQIDIFRANGLFVKQHDVISKTGSNFSVKYTLVRGA